MHCHWACKSKNICIYIYMHIHKSVQYQAIEACKTLNLTLNNCSILQLNLHPVTFRILCVDRCQERPSESKLKVPQLRYRMPRPSRRLYTNKCVFCDWIKTWELCRLNSIQRSSCQHHIYDHHGEPASTKEHKVLVAALQIIAALVQQLCQHFQLFHILTVQWFA